MSGPAVHRIQEGNARDLSRPLTATDWVNSSGRVFKAVVGILLLANAACEGNPAGPSPDRYRNPRLILFCQLPVDVNVSCRATLFDVPRWGDSQDVTVSSTWSVEPPEVAAFTAPGLLTPVVRGEATIHVRYGEHSEAVASAFFVDPRATAQWLYYLQVKVVEKRRADSDRGCYYPDRGWLSGRGGLHNKPIWLLYDRAVVDRRNIHRQGIQVRIPLAHIHLSRRSAGWRGESAIS